MPSHFLIFAGYQDPDGGWEDYYSSSETLDGAIAKAKELTDRDWWHVVDLNAAKIVANGSYKSVSG